MAAVREAAAAASRAAAASPVPSAILRAWGARPEPAARRPGAFWVAARLAAERGVEQGLSSSSPLGGGVAGALEEGPGRSLSEPSYWKPREREREREQTETR